MLAAFSTLLLASTLVTGAPAPAQKRTATVVPLPARANSADAQTKVFNTDLLHKEISRIKFKYGNKNYRDSTASAKRSQVAPFPHAKPLDIATLPHRKHEGRGGSSGVEGLIDDLQDGLDILYYGPISVGTPPQETTVDIDTGSGDLWFPTTSCDDGCPGPLFDKFQSSTYQDSDNFFSVTYGDGSYAYGTVGNDTVSVAGLTVTRQGFGAIIEEGGNLLTLPSAGILGLAFPATSQTGATPFFINLVETGALASPVFSIYLTRGYEYGSQLCIGCIDSSKYIGGVQYYPLDSSLHGGTQLYWNIRSGGFSYNYGNSTGSFSAIIDSGTTLIYIPADAATALYANIPGAQGDVYGNYKYPCNATLGSIAIAFGDDMYELDPNDFNAGVSQDAPDQCVGAIIGRDLDLPGPAAIIGDVFLKRWYSVFDYGNSYVGFASAP